MSSADSRSGRIRRREGEEEDAAQQAAQSVDTEPNNQPAGTTMAAHPNPVDPSAVAAQPQPWSAGVQPLPEQMRKRPRRSPRFSSPLDKLAVVELQLCLQFLDSDSRLKAARCSRRLLRAVSAPFAWRTAPPFVVEVGSSVDVQRISSSLLLFAPVHLRCVGLPSLQCVTTVPHLVGLELLGTNGLVLVTATDLCQLLQHLSLARVQTMRLDVNVSPLLTVNAMRLVARLPQLRSFDVFLPYFTTGAALLQPLTDAPALTNLSVDFIWSQASAALMTALGGCLELRRLRLRRLPFPSGQFRALCSSPSMRQLQHLELQDFYIDDIWTGNIQSDNELRAAFSALQQLQSLTLIRVCGVNTLLSHLHRVRALRLLSIRCEPENLGSDDATSTLPGRAVLSALLTAAPLLEVRLLLPATIDLWLMWDYLIGEDRAVIEQQWRELQHMAVELERVTIVNWEPLSD